MEGSKNRSESERWLSIAEKLLAARDLIGSKTFAIRARESDPKFELADQILAVVDTLLAGEIRINNQHDWYAVLQVGRQINDSELVATQYRRLALLLNPVKNKFPLVDEALKLLSDGWSMLSNPSKKWLYDNELSMHSQIQQNVTNKNDKDSSRQGFAGKSTPASFWTACPYCYNLYEYPSVYEECTLRCQNCSRAFHAIMVPSPPPVIEGEDAYFCSWGFFPLGFESRNAASGSWTPFSAMFTCPTRSRPRPDDVYVQEENRQVKQNVPTEEKNHPHSVLGKHVLGRKNVNVSVNLNVWSRPKPRPKPKVVILDDNGEIIQGSESSEDSEDEWGSPRKKKKAKNIKRKSSNGKNTRKTQGDKVNHKGNQNVETVTNESSSMGGETNKDGVAAASASSKKKQTGKTAKDLGKLDLNVEFSNELEEPAPGMSEGNGTGNGEDDNIEGIGFFEGLDEFLSSLPILSVVGGDDKVKTA